jgi:23S rRNA pseudouridine1911/1915/1917 synthase
MEHDAATTEHVEIHPDWAGWRFDRALAAALPAYSRERLKNLISSAQVEEVGKGLARDPSRKVKLGEHYAVHFPPPDPMDLVGQDIPLNVVYEDAHLIVIDKQAGLVVHPAAGNPDGTLVNALLHHCAGSLSGIGGVARPGIVHRIDKDTSGLMVAAKTDKAHEGLAAQFAKHGIERRYHAIVSNIPVPNAGIVDSWIGRSSQNRHKMAVMQEGKGKHAITHYKMLVPLRQAALVECRLETGRTHQVRVHMTSIGNPLVGDPVYGRTRPEHKTLLTELDFSRQALHAAVLGFVHPVTRETLHFESKMPEDMQRLFSKLMI